MTTPRTSLTHPLQIAELLLPGNGMLGLTFCPGKVQPCALTGSWLRDLDIDCERLVEWGASTVITLMEQHELNDLSVEPLPGALAARNIAWRHLPIEDTGVPDEAFIRRWKSECAQRHAALSNGERMVLHCKGGLGRTGLVAAMICIERGMDATSAIARVRAVRKGAIETRGQERFVRGWALQSVGTQA
jgi:protein-tyrosine phosphatase